MYVAHPHSKRARQWINTIQEVGAVGICSFSQLASLRILNNPTAMAEDVCSGKEAWAVFDSLSQDNRFGFLEEPASLRSHLRQLTSKIKYSPKVWSDAYLAAFAMATGRQLVTFDRGFKAYSGLDVELPG